MGAPVYPVLGDHDILVAGEVVPTAETRALAVGSEALWELPPGVSLPPGTSLTAGRLARRAAAARAGERLPRASARRTEGAGAGGSVAARDVRG